MITLADTIQHAFDTRVPMAPVTESDPDFGLEAGYRAQAALTALRERRGARVVGVKAGFTNTTIWEEYNVHAPIHGPVFDTTWIEGPIAADLYMEPRIEPEVVLQLGASPAPDMNDAALAACVSRVARGFEIVQSPFRGWTFRAADTVAAGALHGALVTGRFVTATPGILASLADFEIALLCDGAVADTGHARNVMGGGPMAALKDLVRQRGPDRLPAGWVVSTGTLTWALPIAPGQVWSTRCPLDLPALTVEVV